MVKLRCSARVRGENSALTRQATPLERSTRKELGFVCNKRVSCLLDWTNSPRISKVTRNKRQNSNKMREKKKDEKKKRRERTEKYVHFGVTSTLHGRARYLIPAARRQGRPVGAVHKVIISVFSARSWKGGKTARKWHFLQTRSGTQYSSASSGTERYCSNIL